MGKIKEMFHMGQFASQHSIFHSSIFFFFFNNNNLYSGKVISTYILVFITCQTIYKAVVPQVNYYLINNNSTTLNYVPA